MPVDFASILDLKQSGASRLTGSQIILPETPSFSARGTTGVIAAGAYIPFNIEHYDIGGGFNPANGLYTAPVGGVYYFFAHFLAESASGGEYRHSLYKNGASYGGGIYIVNKGTDGFWTMWCGQHIQMAAGDYVGMFRQQGPGSHNNGDYYGFGGYLVA